MIRNHQLAVRKGNLVVWVSPVHPNECLTKQSSYLDGAGHGGAGRAVFGSSVCVCLRRCVYAAVLPNAVWSGWDCAKAGSEVSLSRKSFLLVLDAAARRNRIFGRAEISWSQTMMFFWTLHECAWDGERERDRCRQTDRMQMCVTALLWPLTSDSLQVWRAVWVLDHRSEELLRASLRVKTRF